jgi:KRAB domain-containing zinc finger protein
MTKSHTDFRPGGISEGKKTHKCDICSKAFSYVANLKEHLRTHAGERPFCCSVCKKSFGRPSNLTNHMKVHSAEKPYVCLLCSKPFALAGCLKNHMKTHSSDGENEHMITEPIEEKKC